MFRKVTLAAAIGAAFVAPVPAIGADDAEVQKIRDEIKDLKEGYETRIKTLEEHLRQTEPAAAAATPASEAAPPAPQADAAAAAPAATGAPAASQNAFNPAISLILDGTYTNTQRDPSTYRIGGFVPGGTESGPGFVGPGARSFNLGESELDISSNIDPYFTGFFNLAMEPSNTVSIEEAFLQNTGSLPGVTVKAGRFFSGFGYLNEIHAHAWDFVDLPLVHQAFFGGQLNEDGIQARWLAPTPLFVELGVETGRGANFPGSDRNKNGANAGMIFAHLGDDVGISNSYRVGASYRVTHAQDRTYGDVNAAGAPVTDAVTGDSKMWGLDFVWKWAPNGNTVDRNFKFQAEYMRREEDGSLAYNTAGVGNAGGNNLSGAYRSNQSGWYMQGAYQFMPRWRVGLRYEELNSGNQGIGLVNSGALPAADFPLLAENNPKRSTAMIDFSPSEFSRFRLQFARDEARFNQADNQVFLQYIMSLGSHGAHKF